MTFKVEELAMIEMSYRLAEAQLESLEFVEAISP